MRATWYEPLGGAASKAVEAGWTVVVKEVLAKGRLTRGDPPAAVRGLAQSEDAAAYWSHRAS